MAPTGGDGPFIGRTGEMSRLRSALAEATGGGSAVVVCGESGVGKTRLVSEFVNDAARQGATILVGDCTDFGESGPPYWAILEALRPVWTKLRAVPLTTAFAEDPAGTVCATGVADQAPGVATPLFELILQVLRTLSETAPVVLVVEDIHWGDRSTRDLLAFLLANLRRDPVMIIVTYRSEALGPGHSWQPLLAELRRSRRAEFIELRPFTRNEMVAKLHDLLGRAPENDLVELTWSRSDGNPFFAEELVAAVLDGYGDALPPTLRHILMCRVDVLSEAAKRVVRLVAVAGDGVTYPLLATVAEMPEPNLVAALRECVDRQLLTVHPDGRTYRLRHSLMQEALYQDLLPGERHLFHAAYGQALERQAGWLDSMGAARLARHWYAAGQAERALAASIDAAVASAGIYGFAEARRHYERAVELWDQVANPEAVVAISRLELLERAAEVAHLAGEHRRASALVAAAIADLPAAPDAPADADAVALRRAELHQRLGRYLWAAGDSRESLRAYQDAVRCLPEGVINPARARVEGAYAEALMLAGRYRSSRTAAEAALGVAREAGALLEETQILATLGFDLAFLGDSASGVQALERAQQIAEELGSPDDIGRAYLNLAKLLSGPLNHLAEAAEIAALGIARVGRFGLERTYGVALEAIAVNTLFRLGRWPEADEILGRAFAVQPTGTAAVDLCLARAKLSVGRGDVEAAEEDLKAVETLATGDLSPQYEAPLMTLRAGLSLLFGRPEEARQAVDRGIRASVTGSDDVWLLAPLIWHGLWAEADIAEAARARRDPEALEDTLRRAGGLWVLMQHVAEDAVDVAPTIRQAISAYLRLGEGEWGRAEGTTDPDVWADAAARWLELRQPYPAAYGHYREAEALLALRTRSARARDAVRAAHRALVAMEAGPMRRRVEALATRAKITLGEGVPAATEPPAREARVLVRAAARERYHLSDRELEVWLLLPDGLTNNQIGERLYISGKTASVHVTHILRKLGVHSRVQAIALAHTLGLVEVSASG